MRITFIVILIISVISNACSGRRNLIDADREFVDVEAVVLPGDIIHLEMSYYPDFNQTIIVQSDGLIQVEELGPVQVEGMTITQIEKMLTKKYSLILAIPELTIQHQESIDLSVYIAGAINRPGIVQFRKNISLMQGIALAGGLKDQEREHEITIFRKMADDSILMYKLKMPKQNTSPIQDFDLRPLDVIFILYDMPVPRKEFKI